MRRALLVTTGTVVGVASVLVYKPSVRLAENTLTGNLSLAASTAAANTTAVNTTTQAPPTAAARASANPATTARKARSHRKRPAQARATSRAKARASTVAKPKATARPKPRATARPKPVQTTPAASGFVDGNFSAPSEQVISHGRYYGDLAVNVKVSGGRISSISINESGGNYQFAGAVQQYLVPEIIRTQNVRAGIVSGATGTSMALINGLSAVLQKA